MQIKKAHGDILDSDIQDKKPSPKTTCSGYQNLTRFCDSEELSQIISTLNDQALSEQTKLSLLNCIKALFIDDDKERYIIEAIKVFTNENVADALEGLFLYFESNEIPIRNLKAIDLALAIPKARSVEHLRDCNFLNELTT